MISFDGWSGTGKTTQALIVSDTCGIPVVTWNNLFDGWQPEINSLAGAIRNFCNLSVFLKERDSDMVLDCCIFAVIRYMVFNASCQERVDLVESFDSIIRSTASSDPLCFYLFMSEYAATCQRDKRDEMPVSAESRMLSNGVDQKFKAVADWISDQLPYFHVIDGTGSVDDVTRRVSAVLSESAYGVCLEKD